MTTTGAELRAARRAADLTLADVARLGGVSPGHLSRVEKGEREVTPATVELYRRAVASSSSLSSPNVDAVRRRDLLVLAAAGAAVPLTEPRQLDLDECAQWFAWETWRSGLGGVSESDVPDDRAAALAALVQRRYIVREVDGWLRFPHPEMIDFYLACCVFDGVAARSSARLEAAQTTHSTDLVLAQFTAGDGGSAATLTRWMTDGGSAVLRVNAAGVLAKVGEPQATNAVIGALRADDAARALYLTAVASRVLSLPWHDAAQIAVGTATAPAEATDALSDELRNPRDAAARWCSAVLLYQAGAASRAGVRAAVAHALRAEPASENLRTMAALAAGVDPVRL